MSTNPHDPNATYPREPNTLPPHDEPPKKSGSPLLLILLILALLALGWYFLSKREPAAPVDPVTPIGETAVIGADGSDDATTTSGTGDSAAANRQRQRAATPRPAVPANRDAHVVNQTDPEYPAVALRSRIEGTVVVRADVDVDGNPANITVAKSSRDRDLDRAALRAVKDWKFEPAIRDGKPVASAVEVPVDFRIEAQ